MPRGPASTSEVAYPTKASHQHRVVREGVRLIEDAMQQLVIASRGEAEPLSDRSFLGNVELPRSALEVQDLTVTVVEARRV